MSTDVLTVSSKGQVVLPARLRKKLSIESGDHLAVYTSGDVIMLKRIDMPSEDDFKSRLDETQSRLNKSEMEPERLPAANY